MILQEYVLQMTGSVTIRLRSLGRPLRSFGPAPGVGSGELFWPDS